MSKKSKVLSIRLGANEYKQLERLAGSEALSSFVKELIKKAGGELEEEGKRLTETLTKLDAFDSSKVTEMLDEIKQQVLGLEVQIRQKNSETSEQFSGEKTESGETKLNEIYMLVSVLAMNIPRSSGTLKRINPEMHQRLSMQ